MLDDDSFDVRFANLISAKLKPALISSEVIVFFYNVAD